MEVVWLEAKRELGIEVIAPFRSELNGHSVTAVAYLPDFGSPKGTLVFEISKNPNIGIATKHGYFCSQLNPESYCCFNSQLFQETLNDWGWFSKYRNPPSWYTGRPWC